MASTDIVSLYSPCTHDTRHSGANTHRRYWANARLAMDDCIGPGAWTLIKEDRTELIFRIVQLFAEPFPSSLQVPWTVSIKFHSTVRVRFFFFFFVWNCDFPVAMIGLSRKHERQIVLCVKYFVVQYGFIIWIAFEYRCWTNVVQGGLRIQNRWIFISRIM